MKCVYKLIWEGEDAEDGREGNASQLILEFSTMPSTAEAVTGISIHLFLYIAAKI